jgi:uncharacterized membrane protein YgcG
MADKSVFSLDLETEKFDQFKKNFDDYSQKLSGTVAAWKQAAKAINDAKAAVLALNQGMARAQASMRPLNAQIKDYASTVRQALGYWREIAVQTNQIANNVARAASAVHQARVGAGGVIVPMPTGGGVVGGQPGGRGALPAPATRPGYPIAPGVLPGGHQAPSGFNFAATLSSIQGSMAHSARELGGIGKAITSQVFGTGGAASSLMGSTANAAAASMRGGPLMMAISALAAVAGGLAVAPFAAAPGAADLRKKSLGLSGVGVNQLRAASTMSAWLNNPEGLLAAQVTARRDVTSDERRAMGNLFGARTQSELVKTKSDPIGAMFDEMREARRQLLAANPAARDTMAQNRGYATLLGGMGNVRSLQQMSPEELNEREARAKRVAAETATTPAQDKAWTDFYSKMQETGQLIESTLVKKLIALNAPLSNLMDAFVKFVNSNVIDDLINNFADLLKSIRPADVEKGIEAFVEGLAAMYKAIAGFVKFMNGIDDVLNAILGGMQKAAWWLGEKTGIHAVTHGIEKSVTKHLATSPTAMPGMLAGGYLNPDNYKPGGALGPAAEGFHQPAHPSTPTPAHRGWLGGLFHRTAYEGGDDYHQYLQQASFLDNPVVKKGRQAYSWYGKFTGNPASSTLSATSEALLFQKYVLPLLKGYGGEAAAGLGIAAAPSLTGPLTAGGMKGAIASDDANRREFWRLLGMLHKEQEKTNDILTNISLDTTKASADGGPDWHKYLQNASYVTGGDGGGGGALGGASGSWGGGGGGTGSWSGGGGGAGMPGAPSMIRGRGGGFNVSGSTVAKGALKANQAAAYAAAKQAGLSDSSARALVANMSGEALSDPSNVHADPSRSNPNQMAHGIVQWDDKRSAAIKAQFGKMPQDMTVAEQTKAAIWEMKTNPAYKDTWAALQGGGSAESKIGTLVSNYERPADKAAAIAGRIRYLHGMSVGDGGGAFAGGGGSSGGGGASGNWGVKDSSDVIDHLKEMRDKGLVTNQQCVSLATAAVGIKLGSGREGANVHDWRRGDAAQGGGLVAGTPISTFLDRQGRTTDLYAGGGSGTMGAHLDHAAIFEKYIRNKGGAITGMDVAEQYKGSGGTHSRAYMFGRGWGEGDAANYYAVKTASGGYLGGKANPMSRRNMPQGDESPSVAVSNPLGMGNWQAAKKPSISLHNKTGSDVFINASTMSV